MYYYPLAKQVHEELLKKNGPTQALTSAAAPPMERKGGYNAETGHVLVPVVATIGLMRGLCTPVPLAWAAAYLSLPANGDETTVRYTQ